VGQCSSTDTTAEKKMDPKLVGETNEVQVKIDGISTTALCDTGSCISTCSEKFFKDNFPEKQLLPLDNILNIECADGSKLPYSGYITADLQSSGIQDSKSVPCLFLVVPDTDYNKSTPFLLGTNILNELMDCCKEQHGEQFLQKANLHTPWYIAFRCITIREKELRRNKDRIAKVRNAECHSIRIGPNQSRTIRCCTDKEIDHQPTSAIITETTDSALPDFIDITPTVIHYEKSSKSEVLVNVTNLTTNTVNIAPKAIIAELQPVKIDESVYENVELKSDKYDKILEEIEIGDSMTEEQVRQLKEVLGTYKDIFSTGDTDIGQCNLFKHRIELNNPTPFKERHRRIPPGMVEEVRAHLEQLLTGGIIRKSKSPFASNIVLVRKKSGKLRMCVDYRLLNNRTIKDAYALPRVEEIFDCLHGKYFSTIDMKSGYHQVELEEEHKERTAFTVGPLGFFEFNKMPFGLCNSPATYQRLMEECLGDYNMKICVIYLDDLIIFSDTFEEHLERLHLILQRLRECGIKLSSEKCFFLKKKVKFLGHVISENGIETDPDKIEKIKNYPTPSNPDELCSYLAFCGYYRKYVKDFAKVIRPLSDLLPPTSTKKRNKWKEKTFNWKWDEEHQETFDKLKELLTTPPILGYPEFDKPFELHTDASGLGLGAVLYQEQKGQKKVIAYASRCLTKSEKNYSAFKLEFLALKWSVTEKFSDYLIANKFTVYTDNNPLTHVLSSAKLDATGQRWVATLSDYDFDIVYRPGRTNVAADRMSRYPSTKEPIIEQELEEKIIDNKTIKAICNTIYVSPFIEILPHQNVNIVDVTDSPGETMAQIEVREIRKQQREDPIIGVWYRATIDKMPPQKQIISSNPKHQTMNRNFKHFHMIRGILYRKTEDNGQQVNQLVLPSAFTHQVLQGLHNDVGHPGKDRTSSLVRERFYWPGYIAEIERWVQQCGRCLRRKSTTKKAPMVSIESNYPLERVCIDYLTVDQCQGNIENILVITDHYTKYSVAVPTRNQTAKTTADALLNNFFLHYGIPNKLHSDQGRNFESELMKELCQLMDIKKTRTTIYHPMCNGQTERYNRTLLDMLGTLEQDQKKNWKKYLPNLVYAYNATKHESTGYSPFELMFGRKPKLPIDSVFHLDSDIKESITSDYVQELQQRLETSHDIANKALKKARQKQKQQFDKKAKATLIEVGDTVLAKILAYEGRHKIADRFEQKPYTVVSQPHADIPVYIIKNADGAERRLHRNHLLPIEVTDDLKQKEQTDTVKPVIKPRTTKKKKEVQDIEKKVEKDSAKDYKETDSELSDFDYVYTFSGDVERPAGRVDDHLVVDGGIEGTDKETVGKDDTEEVPQILSAEAAVEDEEEGKDEEENEDEEDDEEEDEEEEDENIEAPAPEHLAEDFEPPARPPPPKPPPRRSTRTSRKPAWQRDYICKQHSAVSTEHIQSDQLVSILQEQAALTARLLQTALK